MLFRAAVAVLFSLIGAPLFAQETVFSAAPAYPNGRQVVAVYFGAKWCGPCMQPELKAAIGEMKTLVAAQAKADGAAFSANLVSLDRDLDAGVEFARGSGRFDEYSIGNELASFPAERFIWGEKAASGVPFVIVFERQVSSGKQGLSFGPAKILRTLESRDSILAWVRGGASIR